MPSEISQIAATWRCLWRAYLELLGAWWRIDRIRVSPRDGELLRLEPGSLLTVKGVPAEVRQKQSVDGPGGSRIRYECHAESGSARLEVRFVDEGSPLEIIWSASGKREALFAHQIEVLG